MRALYLALCISLPLLAGDRDPLAEAVEAFGSDHPARRDAGSLAVREVLRQRLAPLLEAMRSKDPEVSRRARESLESLLPRQPGRAEPAASEAEQVVVMGGNQGGAAVVLRVVQANGRGQLRVIHGRAEANRPGPLAGFGVEGEAVLDRTWRRHLRLAEGRGFLIRNVVPDTAAARLGLREDDIVLRIDGAPVLTPEDVAGALGEEKGRWALRRFRVLRDGEVRDLPGE